LTAMAIATLDEISAGRAALGLGAGVSGFAELGIRPHRPPRAIREAISLIRALLRGEQVDFTGEVISFRDGRPRCQTSCRLDRIGIGGMDDGKWLDTDKRIRTG